MLQRDFAHCGIVVPERSPLVALVLKQIWIDGPDPDTVFACEPRDRFGVLARFEIPEHVNRNRRTASGQLMNMTGIRKLVANIDRGSVLEELSETGACVGESP